MNFTIWLPVILRAVSGVLVAQGKADQAALLGDAASAIRQGKSVDDIMAKIAEKWETEGEPSFDEIAEARKDIQARID